MYYVLFLSSVISGVKEFRSQPLSIDNHPHYSTTNLPAMETARLVGGAFPLLLKGVGIYLEGSKKAVDLSRWRRPLRMLIREFTVEYALFSMTCERIFEEVGDTGSMGGISSLMDGKVEIWINSDFEARLANHMGKETAKLFLEQVKLLNDELEDVRKRLGLDDSRRSCKLSRMHNFPN
jgi:hypothetical protein